MVIKRIKTSAFRKFEKVFETNLYNTTSITGKNTSGKTNILYAIVWAFLGSNLSGDERVWLGNIKADNCYVELEFIDNKNIKHILVRNKNKYDSKNSFILLDNKRVKQEELVSFYKDKKLFLSILNPNYFISKKPAEQKELLDKYLPQIDIGTVYNKLDDNEKTLLEEIPQNILDYMVELRANKKMYEDKIKNLKGKIEYAESFAYSKLEEKKFFDKDEELTLARQELSFLNADKSLFDKDRQQELVCSLEEKLIQMENTINRLSTEMSEGKKKYLIIKNAPQSYCPMCEQEVKDIVKMHTIEKMRSDLENKFYEKKDLEKNLTDFKIKINTEKCKLYAIHDNTELKNRIIEVENQISVLEQEKLDIEKYNSSIDIKIKNMNEAKSDIELFENEMKVYSKNVNNIENALKVAQKLYTNYIEEKMKFATKHLNNVSIRYYSVVKESGELKDDFVITYKNIEFKNLSKSESIATALELSNMFNKISGVKLPLFIDDSESCADYDFIEQYSKDTQILIARVNKGQELQISDYKLERNTYLQVA